MTVPSPLPAHVTHAHVLELCHQALGDVFNAAVTARLRVDYVPIYTPDWDSLGTDGFLGNAEFYGVHCLLSGKQEPDENGYVASHIVLAAENGQLQFAALNYGLNGQPNDVDVRLKEVLDFARNWRGQQSGAYSEPRLVVFPALKRAALWLAGAKDVFIPVYEFTTKPGDAIAVDPDYIAKVQADAVKQQELYKNAGPGAGGGLAPPGG